MPGNAVINTLWGGLTAEVLVRLGVEDVVISPGSRSTPLTVGLVRHPRLECRAVLDERSAGFFALGLAQACRRPVVLVCTSGTAVANYLPAVIEAHESGIPLLLLTADRPPELRHRQVGQCIDQSKIYGTFVRWSAEAPIPEDNPEIFAAWRDLLAQAVVVATGNNAGPVHLNCPFREPLGPVQIDPLSSGETWLPLLRGLQRSTIPELVQTRLPRLPERGWVIAGPAQPVDPIAYVRAIGSLADGLGWPILADSLNPCRHFASLLPRPVLTAYDTVLRSPEIASNGWPEAILQIGPLPTSKVLRQRLSAWQLPTYICTLGDRSLNAAGAPAVALGVGPESLVLSSGGSRDSVWWEEFGRQDTRVRVALDDALAGADHTEPAIAALLFEALPPETPIFVSSSMPVRDAECFWGANDERRSIFFNRGANGIDGILSTALGMAEGMQQPSVLYTGDLALLHDTNGMLIAKNSFRGSLTIVCVNNGGGGIFHHLPVAQEVDLFEDYFATPQSVDFREWAGAYGVNYRLANNSGELTTWLRELPEHGVWLLEIRTDREADALFRKGLFERISASL